MHSLVFADDDDDDIYAFTEIVNTLDPTIQVEKVKDGLELLQLLEHYCPDLVFLDLDMPRMNGLECLLAIRKNPLICNLPVVVFSSTSRAANIQAAYEMGASLFLIKSHHFNEYKASLEAILSLDWHDPSAITSQYRINDRYTAFN